MIHDEEIEEIRAARRRISERYGDDLNRLFEHYKEMEKQLKESGRVLFISEMPNSPAVLKELES